tara:strand:- start:1407 stop:2078 length:672 start_codon:yes stop_codon:yes gene_type:complete
MSQNDLVISNQTFPATRADITSALQALGSTNSGATAPTTTYANMMWYDTTNHILKVRAEANDAWISVGYLDQGSDTFKILDDTTVATSSGVTAGLIGDQTTAIWEAGTGITESLVSPAKVKAAIDASAALKESARDVTGGAGYLTLSNGFIFQWDRWSYSHGARNFPITFPNACLGFGYTQYSGWYENWNGYPTSNSSYYTMNIMVGTNASRANYQNMFSIGY